MAHSAQSRNSWILGSRHVFAAGATLRETLVQRIVLNVSFDA
jgi:hypothetical protein